MVAVLVGWTAFVWTTRIGNIWRDHALETGEKIGRTGLALSFTVLAAIVLVAYVRRDRWLRMAVLALAGWTTGVWIVRTVGIATGDHGGGFIAVHAVLAVVSIALAAMAVAATSSGSPETSPTA
jgi:cobalamin synthase